MEKKIDFEKNPELRELLEEFVKYLESQNKEA